jgi:hypothetical protein
VTSPAAYYNEFDPQKAAWLRELIKAGLIAPGDVDERSIKDVRPADVMGYTQCHFFAGIGVWSYALRLAEFHVPSRPSRFPRRNACSLWGISRLMLHLWWAFLRRLLAT